jgi:hypothetical protein
MHSTLPLRATARATARAVFALLITGPMLAQTPAQAPAAAPAQSAEPAVASYVSTRLNAKPLPVTDHASDDKGVQYVIEFDELILAIRPNHEFRASLKYHQTLAAKGAKVGSDPLQKMVVYGTWSVVGKELRFVPDPKRGGNGLRILTGTFSGREIDVPFDYRNGTVSRRAKVVLIRDDHIF